MFLELCRKLISTKRTYNSGLMNFFSFKIHMEQLGQHQKEFHIIFLKKLKITPYCFYELGKL